MSNISISNAYKHDTLYLYALLLHISQEIKKPQTFVYGGCDNHGPLLILCSLNIIHRTFTELFQSQNIVHKASKVSAISITLGFIGNVPSFTLFCTCILTYHDSQCFPNCSTNMRVSLCDKLFCTSNANYTLLTCCDDTIHISCL
jgi:hypothetical protein